MYILFYKDLKRETGEFVKHSKRFSKIAQCHIDITTVVGKVYLKCAKHNSKYKRIVFEDLRLGCSHFKDFPPDQVAEAVQYGKDYFQTYNNK